MPYRIVHDLTDEEHALLLKVLPINWSTHQTKKDLIDRIIRSASPTAPPPATEIRPRTRQDRIMDALRDSARGH